MKKYALIQNYKVVVIKEIEDEDFQGISKNYESIVDVTDFIITPQVGWLLDGNKVVPDAQHAITIKQMIVAKILSYQKVSADLLTELYADNTLTGMTVSQSNAMFEEYSDVIIRLSQGAFPTAIYSLQQKTPSGIVTQENIDNWIAKIQIHL